MKRGLIVAILHCLLVGAVAGKYEWDRQRLPRAWARVMPRDATLPPLPGRYRDLRLVVDYLSREPRARFVVRNGELVAVPDPAGRVYLTLTEFGTAITPPVTFYLPPGAPDPGRFQEGVWAEVSVPENGLPRPLRVEVGSGGAKTNQR